MIPILERLASVSGKKEQALNIQLAQEIADGNDRTSVGALIEGLEHKTKAIRHDCIKTLYEIAALNPGLVTPFTDSLLQLLHHNDNRMQWGAMTALSAIVQDVPSLIFEHLNTIMAVADKGSVITNDHAVKILVALSGQKQCYETTLPMLLERILQSPNNQLPSYAEQAKPVVQEDYKDRFRKILTERLPEVIPESKRKRVEKVLAKI